MPARDYRLQTNHEIDTFQRVAKHTEIFVTAAGNIIRRRVQLTDQQFQDILDLFEEAEVYNASLNKWENCNV